ncbi:MAG: NAD-dependent dihydropyrimidine dehydrogenase subunit PreA [Eubacterium aggregans]|uniref:NAD-dependent dihydropyrimidine dehydrogenase subunit PreA n=1 Tax=Eubacterium aggregans TaxID=81409 RepID=UPI0023F03EA8|nr:NAD-dependent dihydropyrimidine dehydrogenase subunit PreA [Eubacterium aggregans]MDD4690959.1 NAD-dependent dihydropyrimidine dehydrogenase subunit PreA [Eubacterium aggregans]MEA5073924.1 NAD-dependent dihydropyrimidine dehydrogenase subunit PreA [Eubacterium aggregans]
MALTKDLSIDFMGVHCENPFFLSSSPVGSNYEMCAKALEAGWGGIYYKSISVFIPNECSPRFDIATKEGTPWTGFKNMEMTSDKPNELNFEYMRRLKEDYPNKVIVASIMGSSDEEWEFLAKEVTKAGVDLIECNFSCPQMTSSTMGSDVGQNPELVKHYCEVVSKATDVPVIAKMTPNIGNMEIPAIAAIEGGAKGIAAINTVKSITNIDVDNMTGMPVVNGKSSVSGYSGAAVKPIALRFISDMKHDPILKDVPMTGMGGIETWRDCLDFILLGCENLQVTTAIMQYGYRIVEDMISGLSHFMEDHGFERLQDMVGLALPNIVGADDLDRSYKSLPVIDEDKCVGCGRCYVSCFDGGHQAITFDEETRVPKILEDKCVGCHLCLNVCPVMDCILPGKLVLKEGEAEHEIKLKEHYL